MAGEVHYFRLHRADWADRLDKLAAAGCDAVSAYMPWLVHETAAGEVDLTGRTSEYRDLVGFLDLAAERGLLVVARPGPFVMAELKNEGIPFRVYDEHPAAVPVGWGGDPAPSRTLDYLEPGYLADAGRWYSAVMPLLAERQVSRGGPVAAVQLDNEVGMLSWVTNTPELTDSFLTGLAEHVEHRLGRDAALGRFGADPKDLDGWAAWWRSGGTGGSDQQQLAVHHELSAYHRVRYAAYLTRLAEAARECGVTDVPLLVNLHGTGGGRGRTFPIGISQLSQAYAGVPQMTAGSDHYLGELTVENVPDLYTINTFMAAVQDADQPLTSLEFEAGTGDYGEDISRLYAPETTELKTRLCAAQGNRLMSYYLFSGGHNPPLDEPVGDGNDRIAFTGERHGFAAPVDPEGELNPTYASVTSAVRAVHGAEHLLADMDEDHDDVTLGFVPDHYLTEYAHPDAARRREVVAELERFRGMGLRDVLARALLLGGFAFGSTDLSGAATSLGADLDPAGPVLAVASAPVLGRAVQDRLAGFVRAGGRLLLHGAVPTLDDDGTPCTVLADALGVSVRARVDGTSHLFPSVRATDWAGGQPEVRVGVLQRLGHTGTTRAETLAVDVADGSAVGLHVRLAGGGQAVVLACDYPCHLDFWRSLLARLDVHRRVVTEGATPGLLAGTTSDRSGQRLLHLLNVAPVPQAFTVTVDGTPAIGGAQLRLAPRSGLMLPVDVHLDGAVLRWATAELDGHTDGSTVLFRRTRGAGMALIETERDVHVDADVEVTRTAAGTLVSWPGGFANDRQSDQQREQLLVRLA
jgi:beta-galactosidase